MINIKNYVFPVLICLGIISNIEASPIQLDKNNTSPLTWTTNVAKTVNQYFKKPYRDKDHKLKMKINGKQYVVNRPNHALAHGVRQGLLASDIAHSLATIAKTKSIKLQSTEGGDILSWASKNIKNDPYFLQKIEFASAFQRTGRQSEVSSSVDLKLYSSYERADAKNFDICAQKYIGKGSLFKDSNEAQVYKEAILWSTANEGKIDPSINKDLYFLRKIFHAAHGLDLRRMTTFDLNRMKASVVEELFGSNTIDKNNWTIKTQFLQSEGEFVNRLWKRSGEYLAATGDRDIELMKTKYSNKYCELAYDYKKMSKVLQQARKKSTVKF